MTHQLAGGSVSCVHRLCIDVNVILIIMTATARVGTAVGVPPGHSRDDSLPLTRAQRGSKRDTGQDDDGGRNVHWQRHIVRL
jgi:hypothetical protein